MPFFISIIIGISIGYFYGLSFVTQQKRAFFIQKFHRKKQFIFSFCLSIGRLLLLCGFFGYLLHYPAIHSILLIVSFMGAFWFMVLNKRVYPHERT